MAADLVLGVGAALIWIAILLHALVWPARRVWPPRTPSPFTVLWSWGLTILIYVGIVRLGSDEGNALDLPSAVRWYLGCGVAIAGTLLQSWGTAALGFRQTSGWPGPLCVRGPYKYMRHPQYLGQGLSFVGLALFFGGVAVWAVALAGVLALSLAAFVEDVHLRTAVRA